MPGDSAIGWTEKTWNPVTGCSKVSPGCAHCYAETFAERWRGIPGHAYEQGFDLRLWPERLDVPLRWKKPAMIFVNSMSDLFHEDIPDGFIAWVFYVMAQCPQHTFQVLTKRPARMRDFMLRWAESLDRDEHGALEHRGFLGARGAEAIRAAHNAPRALLFADMLDQWGDPPDGAAYPTYDWMDGPLGWPAVPDNVWLGVSIENRRFVSRADVLRETPAAVRFVSAEPLLGPLVPDGVWSGGDDGLTDCAVQGWTDGYDGPELDLTGIDWLIAGGESGPEHRRPDPEWIRGLRDACLGQSDTCDICGGFRRLDPMGGPAHHVDIAATTPCTQRHTQFFFKQWGGSRPNSNGRELDGRTWDEMPASAVVT